MKQQPNRINEILIIGRKFQSTQYPERLINRVIKSFGEKASESDDYSIRPGLSEVVKKLVLMIQNTVQERKNSQKVILKRLAWFIRQLKIHFA